MIENRLIICIASRWDLDPTSKHHLMKHLSERNDVVWVNYHGSRRPGLNRHDARAALGALRRVVSGVQPVSQRMAQLTPLVLPGAPTPRRESINHALLVAQIRRAVAQRRRSSDQPVQLWTFAPDVAHLAGAFGEEALVYYCVDEFSQFEGYDGAAVMAAEQKLIAAANVIITTSDQLLASRAGKHPRVHLVRHGVEHAHFAQAVTCDLPVPLVMRQIRRPVAGFVGLVQHWFDVELMRAVAARLPDVNFVIVGECQVDVTPLSALENVHFIGRQPYADLPAYCRAFDVGLIPFVRSPMTENVNPIKLREYLAAGLPVVSTDLPEVRRFAPDVLLADTPDGFANACQKAVVTRSPEARKRRSAAVADQSWEAVTRRVERLVMDAITKPAHSSAGFMTELAG